MNNAALFSVLNLNFSDGKHMVGALIGEGSWFVIGAIVVVAIVAAVFLFLRKKKRDKKGEKEDE